MSEKEMMVWARAWTKSANEERKPLADAILAQASELAELRAKLTDSERTKRELAEVRAYVRRANESLGIPSDNSSRLVTSIESILAENITLRAERDAQQADAIKWFAEYEKARAERDALKAELPSEAFKAGCQKNMDDAKELNQKLFQKNSSLSASIETLLTNTVCPSCGARSIECKCGFLQQHLDHAPTRIGELETVIESEGKRHRAELSTLRADLERCRELIAVLKKTPYTLSEPNGAETLAAWEKYNGR